MYFKIIRIFPLISEGPKVKYIICTMDDVRGDFLYGTTSVAVIANKTIMVSSLESSEIIQKTESGPFCANWDNNDESSSVTLNQ